MQYHNKLKLKNETKLRNKTKNKQKKQKKTQIKTPNLIWEYNFKAIGMDSKTDYRRKDY